MRTRRPRTLESIAVSLAASTLLVPVTVSADCQCLCINGEVEAVCSSSLDVRPVCAPRICPIVPPAVRPIDPPRVPPVGTSDCRSEQVWNGEAYEWVEICR
jgi:hypothetical protein